MLISINWYTCTQDSYPQKRHMRSIILDSALCIYGNQYRRKHTPFVFIDGFWQCINRLNVQVICGLILYICMERLRKNVKQLILVEKSWIRHLKQHNSLPRWGRQVADKKVQQIPLLLSDHLKKKKKKFQWIKVQDQTSFSKLLYRLFFVS